MRQSITLILSILTAIVSATQIVENAQEKALEHHGHGNCTRHHHRHHCHEHHHHRHHCESSDHEESHHSSEHHHHHRNRRSSCTHPPHWTSDLSLPEHENTHVKIKPDKGWYPFVFGNSQTDVRFDFSYHTDRATVLTVADAFCAGDYFQFFDNGRLVGYTRWNCEEYPYWNPEEACAERGCQYYQENPLDAIEEGNHCYGTATLVPGYHNITIQTLLSCETAGTAYIRVDKACWNYYDTEFDNDLVPCCIIRNGCNQHINDYFECKKPCHKKPCHKKPCHKHSHRVYDKNDSEEEQ